MGYRAARFLLAASILTLLAGCSSPFGSRQDSRSSRFIGSVLAHSLADGSLLRLQQPTIDEGVHVDWPKGSALRANQDITSAVIPAGGLVSMGPIHHARTVSVKVPLSAAIAEALRHNLAITFQAYNPPISRQKVITALAAFDPSVFGGIKYQHIDQPTPFPETIGAFSQIGVNREDEVNPELGIRKRFSLTGATVAVFGNDDYQDIHSSSGLPPDINPSHTAGFGIELKQPLLRGFGPSVNRARIYIARRNASISRSLFRSYVIKVIARVERTYLQLVNATDDVRIDRQLLARSIKTLTRLKDRLHMDVDAVQINQARAAVDLSRYRLAAAQAQVADASEALKALMNNPRLPTGGGPIITPVTRVVDVPLAFNLRQQIAAALSLRGIIYRDRLAAEKAGIRRHVASNGLLPKLDLVASSDTAGLASDGSYPGAFNQVITAPHVGYSMELRLSFPLGNRAAKARYRIESLRCRQALVRILRDAQKIARNLATYGVNLRQDWRRVRYAKMRERSAAQVLTGLRVQERSGQALTPTFLQLELNAQQSLASAQSALAQALVQYNTDLVEFERQRGSLLTFNNIHVK